MKSLLVWMALLGVVAYAQAGPLDKIKPAVEKVVPELWDVSIHLKGGEVVKVEKVGFTEYGLRKRLTINAAKKTLTVIPVGSEEARRISTADIEKIEMTPHKKPEVVPQPKPVSANCKCDNCKCNDCKCND